MLAAYDAESRWLDAVKAALVAFLRFLEEEPALGRLLVVYSLGGGERIVRRRVEVLRALAAAVDQGRLEALRPTAAAPRGDRRGRRRRGARGAPEPAARREGDGVLDLFGSLVSIIVLPYLGAGVARRELMRPPPRVSERRGDRAGAPGHSEVIAAPACGSHIAPRAC